MDDGGLKLRLKLWRLGFPCNIYGESNMCKSLIKHDNNDKNEESWRFAKELTKILKNFLDVCVCSWCVLGVFEREMGRRRWSSVKCGGGRDGDVVGEWERVGESGRDVKWDLHSPQISRYLGVCIIRV